MSVKPILFSAEMVRAIIAGRKTVTRRVVKFLDKRNPEWSGYIADGAVLYGSNNIPAAKSSYQPGDILYVRETWCKFIADHVIDGVKYAYRADTSAESERFRKELGYKWRPSIHMPREAARIWLRVTDVRVEQLQAISYEDLQREGGKSDFYKVKRCRACGYGEPHYPECDYEHCDNYERLWEESFLPPFIKLWDSTIKHADLDRYGWDANPWVWRIQFERCEKPEEA